MKFKKLLLSLGTVAAVAAPVAAVVACGVDESKVNYVFKKADAAWKTDNLDKDGTLKAGYVLKAQTVDHEGKPIDSKLVPFEVKATTDAGKTTHAFSKGTAVHLIKTVVQFLQDSDVKKASTFKVEIALTGDAGKTRATLAIDLGGVTEVKDITEKLVVIKKQDGSTPKDIISLEKGTWTFA